MPHRKSYARLGIDDSLPQYEKNRLLNSKLKDLETDLLETTRKAQEDADEAVRMHKEFIDDLSKVANSDVELVNANRETIAKLSERTAVRNDRLARLKLLMELKSRNFTAYHPEWLKYLEEVKKIIKEYGYSNRTRWRGSARQLLVSATRAFGERNGLGQPVLGDFHRLTDRLNSYTGDALAEAVEDLADRAGDLEGERDPTFQLLRLEFRLATQDYKRVLEIPAYRDDDVREAESRKSELRRLAREGGERVGLGRVVGGGRSDHRREASHIPKPDTVESLRLARRLPVTRDNQQSILKSYNRIFASCANNGDWSGAVKCYEDYVARGFVPGRFVYMAMIGSCKTARPVQVDRAVALLEEMGERGGGVTTAAYNSVLDACRAGGSWRRGLQLFGRMQKEGICKPNTNTYSVLAKMGFEARNDDPGDVYSAMKFAGVPEYIAYTSAAGGAMRAVEDRGGRRRMVQFNPEKYRRDRSRDSDGGGMEEEMIMSDAVKGILLRGLEDEDEDDRTISTLTTKGIYRGNVAVDTDSIEDGTNAAVAG